MFQSRCIVCVGAVLALAGSSHAQSTFVNRPGSAVGTVNAWLRADIWTVGGGGMPSVPTADSFTNLFDPGLQWELYFGRVLGLPGPPTGYPAAHPSIGALIASNISVNLIGPDQTGGTDDGSLTLTGIDGSYMPTVPDFFSTGLTTSLLVSDFTTLSQGPSWLRLASLKTVASQPVYVVGGSSTSTLIVEGAISDGSVNLRAPRIEIDGASASMEIRDSAKVSADNIQVGGLNYITGTVAGTLKVLNGSEVETTSADGAAVGVRAATTTLVAPFESPDAVSTFLLDSGSTLRTAQLWAYATRDGLPVVPPPSYSNRSQAILDFRSGSVEVFGYNRVVSLQAERNGNARLLLGSAATSATLDAGGIDASAIDGSQVGVRAFGSTLNLEGTIGGGQLVGSFMLRCTLDNAASFASFTFNNSDMISSYGGVYLRADSPPFEPISLTVLNTSVIRGRSFTVGGGRVMIRDDSEVSMNFLGVGMILARSPFAQQFELFPGQQGSVILKDNSRLLLVQDVEGAPGFFHGTTPIVTLGENARLEVDSTSGVNIGGNVFVPIEPGAIQIFPPSFSGYTPALYGSGTVVGTVIGPAQERGEAESERGPGPASNVRVINNGGLIEPGAPVGTLRIEGDLVQNSGSIVIEIGGTGRGMEHDQIAVTGDISLYGGNIELRLMEGFTLPSSFSLEIFTGFSSFFIDQDAVSLIPPAGVEIENFDPLTGMITITPPPGCPGDVNGDLSVGLADIAVMIQHWSKTKPPVPPFMDGDLTGDGMVTMEDVAIVIMNWAATCR